MNDDHFPANVAINAQGLTVNRGGRTVIHNINFSIPAGLITGLLGPSGCGKSTVLRSIVGSQIVASGSITVLGYPAGNPLLRNRLGYSTQTPAVYLDLTVRENLAYFASVVNAQTLKIDEVISTLDLESHQFQQCSQLSGGQLSRVSLGVALLNEPELLILDEPTVGLDPVLRKDLWELFRQLANSGKTLIISSHVMDEATRCDSLLLMRDGRIIAHDSPQRLCDQTVTRSVEDAFLKIIELDMQHEDSI